MKIVGLEVLIPIKNCCEYVIQEPILHEGSLRNNNYKRLDIIIMALSYKKDVSEVSAQ